MKISADSSRTPPPTHGPACTPEGAPIAHFGLTGRSVALDRRVNAVRGDIADLALAGTLFAPHYARPLARQCHAPAAAVRLHARDDAELVSELLLGEGFAVLDISGGWAWGYCVHDHYVGFVREAALGPVVPAELRVSARAVPLRAAPDPASPVTGALTMGARVGGETDRGFFRTPAGFVSAADLAPLDAVADPVDQALLWLDTPYRLGGRGGEGIDCSGLVQIALAEAGITAPRDSDQQAESVGTPLLPDAKLRRGDLVFLPGHVGIMVDGETLLHANGFAMAVTREPLAAVLARADDPAAMTARRP